ncbi:MMPL family protein [Candidatus Izimaplasma bacterium HR1]|jgi:predicted RND superfamily exporter protein|uniref:efflux RND transporter permease subunit n=1 Tax=Candidatus Izimoplasma sp. HR1 TaxID=1541959 RepID=UPI0004F6E4A1|nr:MMPL family protein [Candidatus Izimaplasma bacterium HR1]
MRKYTNTIFTHKRILFVLFIIINIFALLGVIQIKLDTDFASFSPDESIYKDRLEEIEDIFGELNQLIVIVEVDDINRESLDDMKELQSTLSSIDDITYVQGAAPEQLIINGNVIEYNDIPADTVINYYSNFGDFSPIKEHIETNYFVFTLFIDKDFSNSSITDIEDSLNANDYQSYISGDSYNQLKITDYIIRILLILPPLAIIVIFLVFRWQMGAIKPTLLSVLPAGIGSLWTFGLIGWIGNEVSILTAVVPIFIIVIGSADGLHFMSHYQDSKAEGKSNHESLVSTLRLVGIPMIVTTLTSMAGFLSLLTISTSSIKDLSLYSAIGILLAGVATWYVLPLILSNDMNVARKKAASKKIDIAKGLRKLSGIPSIILAVLIVVVSIISYPKINTEFNMLMVYKESTIVSINAEKATEVNGGSIPLYVTLAKNDNIISLDTMDEVETIINELNNLDEVNKVINPFELMNIVYSNQFLGEIPNDMVLNNIYNNLSSDPNSTIHDLISYDDNTVRLLIFPSDLNNDTLGTIEEAIDNLNLETSVTGVQYLMKDLNDSISQMQLNSIILALGIVLIMLVITLKSFKIAFYSLIPILITVISLYGFLGISQIPLNITTVIIFSITIGVGIDYAVHFSSVYKYYLKETNNNEMAIDKAYSNSSRPIIANALGISLGLSIMVLSPLTIHFNVSMLMWVSMIVSVVLTLTLLPFIFKKRGGKKNA